MNNKRKMEKKKKRFLGHDGGYMALVDSLQFLQLRWTERKRLEMNRLG
jgi:hypothetical protein